MRIINKDDSDLITLVDDNDNVIDEMPSHDFVIMKTLICELGAKTPIQRKWVQGITRQIDLRRILAIASRAARDLELDEGTVILYIESAHAVTPLRLFDLYTANHYNFAHDVHGIMKHLDRHAGKFKHRFRPRFAA